MPTPVTISRTTLFFDALPAIKTRCYYGEWPRGEIYTIARMYIQASALHVSLSAFEKEPDATSLISFGIASQADYNLFLTLSPDALTMALHQEGREKLLDAPQTRYFTAADEQGFSWGAQFTLLPDMLPKARIHFSEGELFYTGLYKHYAGLDGVGSAAPLKDVSHPFSTANFSTFQPVVY